MIGNHKIKRGFECGEHGHFKFQCPKVVGKNVEFSDRVSEKVSGTNMTKTLGSGVRI